jgi:hypothetical protein
MLVALQLHRTCAPPKNPHIGIISLSTHYFIQSSPLYHGISDYIHVDGSYLPPHSGTTDVLPTYFLLAKREIKKFKMIK